MHSGILARTTRAAASRPRRVLAAWAVLVIAALASAGALLADATTTNVQFISNPESKQAQTAIDRSFAGDAGIVETVVVRGDRAGSVAAELARSISGLDGGIGAVHGPADSPALVSRDGRTALVTVAIPGNEEAARARVASIRAVTDAAARRSDLKIGTTGTASISEDLEAVSREDLARAEMIGLPIALLILVLVFRSVAAALVPIFLAVVSIVTAVGLTAVIGSGYRLSFFITNMITMMGLAVGIDYALFVISRYREERERGVSTLDAIERASLTSGRAVLYSGLTVVVALVGLLIVPTTIFLSLGLGAILVVLAALAASVTLLPATLALLGPRIEFGRLPHLRSGGGRGWSRLATAVMRRPWLALVGTVAALALAAIPASGMRTGASGIETLPSSLSSKQAYDVLASEFGAAGFAPVDIVLTGAPSSPGMTTAIARLQARLDVAPFARGTAIPAADGSAVRLVVPLAVPPASKEATAAVRTLRATTVPEAVAGTGVSAAVGGATSQNIDYFDVTDRYLPYVVAIVLALSFGVLLIAFRSLVVPLLAIALNLLSVGAAYGLLTLVTQDGVGAGLLGFQQVPQVEAWIPLFLFSVLFGLSMDYHVFLLSRIRERYAATGDTADAISHGISTSARLITGAALIMVAVFAGFASGELVMFQQMGFGLAVAILLDATVVRSLLVPAAMRLLDHRNWYLPHALDRLPHVEFESAPARS